MRLGRIRNVDPEHGPIGGNQDAMVLPIDADDGAIKTLLLGEAGVRHQADKDDTEEDSEKSRTHSNYSGVQAEG